MFDRLDALLVEAHACVAGLNGALLSGVDAATALRKFAQLELLGAAGRILLAKRVDETHVWDADGSRNAAEWIAKVTGSTVGGAKDDLDTSWNLGEQPDVADAVRAGDLSKEKASAVSRAAKKAPDAERDLVKTAKRAPLSTVRDECNKAKARAEDPAERTERCHKARRAWFGAEQDGMVPLMSLYPVATAAKLRARLDKRTDQIFRARNRAKDEQEPRDRYMADALAELILGASDSKKKSAVRTNVQIRVDLAALRRGTVEDGEVCDAPGTGELTPNEVERLLLEDDPIIDALLMRGTDLLKHVRIDRYIPVDMQRGLEFRDATCVVTDCNYTTRLERDHIDDYAKSKRTAVDNLRRPCPHHHRLKTLFGWELVEHPDGTRTMEPP